MVPASAESVRAYELMLAAAAEDFVIDQEEVEDLGYLVAGLRLTPDQVRAAHQRHLQQLLDDCLSDGC